jgi:hypothetical protein
MSVRRHGGHKRVTLGKGGYALARGATLRLRLPLTRGARKLVASLTAKHDRRPAKLKGQLQLNDSGSPTRVMLKRPVRLPR